MLNMQDTKNQNLLLHGSNVVVECPKIRIEGHYKDFGYGFYCTKLEIQARRWALTRHPQHIINVYSYAPSTDLAVMSFPEMTEEWLDFVTDCRRGVEHLYDVVEGPMADDQVWDYVEDFAKGEISREAFWALVKFKHPTHQIVFCTEKALSCLAFVRYYSIEK